ncbi:hypothetical protein [Sphingomonas sp. LHG3406-1]|uniref:hypothetical protein n=1 Tax=Sphingomonas sp. LHG3406-1 TaxID=2804617 RepID=UPI0026302058|nr:hypothetical protein [Sphingomonas sp. LHG3406-1]
MTLAREDNEKLAVEAARRGILPATLAAEFVREGLKRAAAEKKVERPAAELKRWLEPFLGDLRRRGGWPEDITITVFEHIRDQAHDLYDAAAEDVGRSALNRELGRMVKERLDAEVVTIGTRPKVKKVRRNSGSLIQLATLLKPKPGEGR